MQSMMEVLPRKTAHAMAADYYCTCVLSQPLSSDHATSRDPKSHSYLFTRWLWSTLALSEDIDSNHPGAGNQVSLIPKGTVSLTYGFMCTKCIVPQ